MRSELQLLNAKLAARDKQLLQHVKVRLRMSLTQRVHPCLPAELCSVPIVLEDNNHTLRVCADVQDVEETQLASLRTELAAAQSRAQSSEAAYSQLRSTLAAVHAAMGPQVGPAACHVAVSCY